MSTLKTVTLAAALIVGTTSLTMAQNNNGMPPDAYKGPGAYQSYKAEDFQQPGNTGTNAGARGGNGTQTGQRTRQQQR